LRTVYGGLFDENPPSQPNAPAHQLLPPYVHGHASKQRRCLPTAGCLREFSEFGWRGKQKCTVLCSLVMQHAITAIPLTGKICLKLSRIIIETEKITPLLLLRRHMLPAHGITILPPAPPLVALYRPNFTAIGYGRRIRSQSRVALAQTACSRVVPVRLC
jgi:hypothetical protein